MHYWLIRPNALVTKLARRYRDRDRSRDSHGRGGSCSDQVWDLWVEDYRNSYKLGRMAGTETEKSLDTCTQEGSAESSVGMAAGKVLWLELRRH